MATAGVLDNQQPPLAGLRAMKLSQGTHVIITGPAHGLNARDRLAVPDVLRLDIWLEWNDSGMRSYTPTRWRWSRQNPFPLYNAEVREAQGMCRATDAKPVYEVKSEGLTIEGLIRRLQAIALTSIFSTAAVSVFSDSSTIGFSIADNRLQLVSQGASRASMEEVHLYYRRVANGYEEEIALAIMSRCYV